jgi:hypothetical protein
VRVSRQRAATLRAFFEGDDYPMAMIDSFFSRF